MTQLVLTPGQVSLSELSQVFWHETPVSLDRDCKPAVEDAASRIDAAAAGTDAVYGVNTGFGKLASIKIAAKDTATLATKPDPVPLLWRW